MKDTKIIELNSSSRKMSAFERRLRMILALEPAQRLRAILEERDAKALVAAMPPQELLITIKQVGEPDAMPLIEMASPAQVRFFTDIEWWIGDMLDPQRILKWLEMFIEIGDDKVLEWLKSVDAELLVTVLHKFMIVTKPEEGHTVEKLADTMPPYTIDNVYYLHFFGEDAYRVFSRVLLIFSHHRPELYRRLMEGVVWEVGPETEELAIRWRNGRLRDIGIPGLDEALEAYRYLDEDMFWRLPPKEAPLRLGDNDLPLQYPLARGAGERHILLDALRKITDPRIIDGITQELAHLVNRVMVADSEDLADIKAMFNASRKVRATVSMGLEALSGADLERASDIIHTRWLLHVFRVGHSKALKLTRRAYAMARRGWLSEVPEALELLDEPLGQIFRGVKRPRPAWYIGGAEPYRSFLSLDEVAIASDALDRIEYLGQLFFNRLKLLKPEPSSWRFKRVYPVELTFATILRTAFANAVSGRGFVFRPLHKSDLNVFLEKAFENDPSGGVRRIPESVRADFTAYLDGRGTVTSNREREIRDEFVASCIDSIEDELGGLVSEESLDPRFIQGLVIRR